MKKILQYRLHFLPVLLLTIIATSCLKDERFEDGEYQTINANTEGQEWVSIPQGAQTSIALGVESKAGFQTVPLFVVSYDYVNPAPEDITVTLTLNNGIVTQRDPSLTVLPANAYTIPSLNITIPAGKRVSGQFPLSVNTSLLDPSIKYGIGFSIASVSKAGVNIAANMKDVVFVFTIKNKYDAIYTLRSRMDLPDDRPAAWTRTPFTYAYEIHLITTGPNTVRFFNTAFGAGFHPLQTPAVSGFGATEPVFTFDANDKLVSVVNGVPNPSNGRAFQILTGTDPQTGQVINSRYDPATKTVYAAFTMTQPGFAPINIFDTLRYVRPRP